MSVRIITAIAFKLFAIYLGVHLVLTLPSIWGMYNQFSLMELENQSPGLFPYIIGVLVVVVGLVAVLAIFKLGSSVIDTMPNNTEKIDIAEMERILWQILGCYFIVVAIKYLPTQMVMAGNESLYDQKGLVVARLSVATYVFQLIFGFLLVVKSEVWQMWVRRLRAAGSNRAL